MTSSTSIVKTIKSTRSRPSSSPKIQNCCKQAPSRIVKLLEVISHQSRSPGLTRANRVQKLKKQKWDCKRMPSSGRISSSLSLLIANLLKKYRTQMKLKSMKTDTIWKKKPSRKPQRRTQNLCEKKWANSDPRNKRKPKVALHWKQSNKIYVKTPDFAKVKMI